MMSEIASQIESSWKALLSKEIQSDYFAKLELFLVEEEKNHTIFPTRSLIFNAFKKTPFPKVKVVILGQDPYHGLGQAHGLCFSVPKDIKVPPSLVNIFKELSQDIGCRIPTHGNLESWAEQGVLLLNASLTVRENQAGSHQKKGWETFTDAVIKTISEQKENLVFILWGSFAQSKIPLIDQSKHLVLTSVHPSPLSANRGGFFGTKPFSKTNQYLISKGKTAIDWGL